MDVKRFNTEHIQNCPQPTDLFFNQSHKFGQDIDRLGSGYGTLVHLIVFTVFTLVSFFLQKLVGSKLFNWSSDQPVCLLPSHALGLGGEGGNKTTLFFIELIFLSFSLELLQWLQSCAVGRTSGC